MKHLRTALVESSLIILALSIFATALHREIRWRDSVEARLAAATQPTVKQCLNVQPLSAVDRKRGRK